MKYTTATLLALVGTTFASPQAGSSTSSSSNNAEYQEYEYINSVCMPHNATGYPDTNTPCVAVRLIQTSCIYGEEYLNKTLQYASDNQDSSYRRRSILPRQSDDEGDAPTLGNSTQRLCVCQSQFFNQAAGCASCYRAHGSSDLDAELSNEVLTSMSAAYCAASATPTLGFADFLFDFANSIGSTMSPTSTPTSSFHDPLGNRTAVSLYFTPSVTGSAAWLAAEQTGSSTSLNNVNGQIKPTADASGSGTSTSDGGAAATQVAVAGAGLIGLAGIVALL